MYLVFLMFQNHIYLYVRWVYLKLCPFIFSSVLDFSLPLGKLEKIIKKTNSHDCATNE